MGRFDRRTTLTVLLASVAVVTTAVLWDVLATIFFAITVAYVLFPVRRYLSRRGLDARLAAAASTAVAFLAAGALAAPVAVVVYLRRDAVVRFIRELPASVPVTVFEFTYVLDLRTVRTATEGAVLSLAVDVVRATPVLALKAVLFTFLVYALLLRPGDVQAAAFGLVPPTYHDVVERLHRRIRDTLYAIYVLQAATAFGTFLVAYVVFAVLGYDTAFSLAVLSGILQFVPIVGPSVVVVGLAGLDLLAGDPTGAAVVLVVGLVLVGFLPDAVIRPKLATITGDLSASLYFVGFIGGVLTVGVVGFVAGPLVVALLVEVVELLSTDDASVSDRTERGAATQADEGSPSQTDDEAAATPERDGHADEGDPSQTDDEAAATPERDDRDGATPE